MRRVLSAWWIVFLVAAVVTLQIPFTLKNNDHRITRAAQDVRDLDVAVELFFRRQGDYPPPAIGFSALVDAKFVSKMPIDPWGNPYAYRSAQNTPAPLIYSIGVDGRDDAGAGDDVIGGEKRYRCEDYGGCAGTKEFVALGALALAAVSLLVGVARGLLALRS